ncbi:hypothetical protein B0J13DRAFT_673210 [Dactylonectria estremocensis]|uniref:Uncharacterized protein n=1 Tax=Dactylonectria estremocensis TaxID=1079267 RepID=A0A9P9F2V7_9HYPO|nr:hypothetical protein B0J13DRAFT_673210 [Dactylonectria estremocensis]
MARKGKSTMEGWCGSIEAALLPAKFYHSPYTSSIDVLDFATVVIPVTFAKKDVDQLDPGFRPLTDKDKMNMESYDAEAYDDAPASIQLVSRGLDEEPA